MNGGFCVFAKGGCSLSDCFTDRVQGRCDCLRMWTNFSQNGFKIEPAQGTGSDRKVAKAAIRGTLGPRLPWRGTLSSSDPVPCALSLFVAV